MVYQMQSPVGPRVTINGRECDYFAGCSYLGLQNHPALIAAAAEALQRYGLGTATSAAAMASTRSTLRSRPRPRAISARRLRSTT